MTKIKDAQRQAARVAVCEALEQANGRIPDAAKLCGISRQAFTVWVRKLGINPADWRIK